MLGIKMIKCLETPTVLGKFSARKVGLNPHGKITEISGFVQLYFIWNRAWYR